ncbi:MAG: DUF4838 domain-containing protein, partial [bacterium]|nr:DUF4838 domain-containing protein [bacterium]
MKQLLLIVFCLCLAPCAVLAESLDLSTWSDARIVIAEQPILSEQYAAQEFQSLFNKATGLSLPIETAVGPTHNIFIGDSTALRGSAIAVAIDDLGEEGLRYRITPEQIAIAGGKPRGTLYGVYEFMEREMGIRFLTFDHTYIPAKKRWPIEPTEVTFIPKFSFRWSYYFENVEHPEFAARLRVNTTTRDEKLGGVTRQNLINHSFQSLLPVEQYGKDHPEYFALVDGVRKLEMGGGGPEPCVSNPEVIEIMAQNAIKQIEADPGVQNISVSQNDNDAYCRCEQCEAINQREGTPMGSNLALVNAVAERIEKKFPNVKVGTLAYWYTRKPPKTIRPRDNVQIQLCSIECCTLHAIDDPTCEKNREFCQDMENWGKICKDIWVWNYNTNFSYYDLPFPNFWSISQNVQYFLKNNTHGLFMQANGNGRTGELCDLRNYVISRCIWNPERDSWQEAQEFCRLHYGKAAKTIIQYLRDLKRAADRCGYHPNCFPRPFEVGLNPAVSTAIYDSFEKAMKEAENDTVRARVEKASISAVRAVIETCGHFTLEEGRLRMAYPERYGDLVTRYKELTEKYGQTRAEEWPPIQDYFDILQRYIRDGVRGERLENETWRVVLLPEDNGKIVQILHKPTDRYLVMHPNFRTLRHLFEYLTLREESTGYNTNSPGIFAVESQPNALVLSKTLPDGSVYRRELAFKEDAPNTLFFSSRLDYQGEAPVTAQFAIRPQYFADSHPDK